MKRAIFSVFAAVFLLFALSACNPSNQNVVSSPSGDQTADPSAALSADPSGESSVNSAGQESPVPVTSDFSAESGKIYSAYVYVTYVGEDCIVGDGNFIDSVYIFCPGANDTFKIFDTAYIEFSGGDYVAEPVSVNTGDTDQPVINCAQKIKKVISASKSDGVSEPVYAKPIIYFYPEEETACSVKIDIDGELTCVYPEYGAIGWNFNALPDGTLCFDDGREFYALYWEGKGKAEFNFSKGFCVKGCETASFLESVLPKLGLSARESNEFIIYWLPLMQDNAYNLISFQTVNYYESVKLLIEPAPKTLIRVFMAYKPLSAPIDIAPQELTAPERTGFTVVEWGGSKS